MLPIRSDLRRLAGKLTGKLEGQSPASLYKTSTSSPFGCRQVSEAVLACWRYPGVLA